MARSRIFETYNALQQSGDLNPQGRINLRDFIENYAVSLPAIIHAFPRGNLDIKALEAHIWDRIKQYYRFQNLDLPIETSQEAEFINESIKLIEDWFYKGQWTSCLDTPAREEIAKILSNTENNFLENTRRKREPNVGRDDPVPNIYDAVRLGKDSLEIYRYHAFKFFHGPAAVSNTLTKVNSERQIFSNESRLRSLVNNTVAHYRKVLEAWGYELPKIGFSKSGVRPDQDVLTAIDSEAFVRSKPKYIGRGEEFKRELFFFKTSMAAAEMIRRTGKGRLTKDGFKESIQWLKSQPGYDPIEVSFLSFDFAPGNNNRTSFMHVNSKELPFALFAVDYLKHKHDNAVK